MTTESFENLLGEGIDLSPIREFGLNLTQYFGLWAIEETQGLALWNEVRRRDLRAHVAEHAERDIAAPAADFISWTAMELDALEGRTPAQTEEKIALIDINGTITKRGSSFSSAGSTIRIQRQIRQLARDPDVAGIILRIDSPGGTIAGVPDLAREIRNADARKPVYAFVEDMTASAAYWLAVSARKIFANENTALIGSIGNFIALYDYSKFAEKEGIRAVLIRSGEFKGLGFPGTEITGEQEAYLQSIVDKTQVEFSGAVSSGRKLSAEQVAELADGRVHPAQDALRLKLIDGIQTLEETVTELQREVSGNKPSTRKTRGNNTVTKENATETSEPQAASIQELEAACPGADEKFILDQIKRGATLGGAQKAFIENQKAQLEMRENELKELKEKQTKTETPRRGAPAIGNGGKAASGEPIAGAEIDDPIEAFEAAILRLMAAGMERQQALKAVATKHPDLHRAYILATNNDSAVAQRLVREKFNLA